MKVHASLLGLDWAGKEAYEALVGAQYEAIAQRMGVRFFRFLESERILGGRDYTNFADADAQRLADEEYLKDIPLDIQLRVESMGDEELRHWILFVDTCGPDPLLGSENEVEWHIRWRLLDTRVDYSWRDKLIIYRLLRTIG